jgi:hypothetical protein
MSSIIPFEGSKLPAYLKNFNVSDLNDDLTAHSGGGGFPIISIKGKNFTVVRDKERHIIPNPKDPESPATSIDMVIIKANKGTSKVFYINGYSEGAENTKPDCFSPMGDKPDASSTSPQSKACATCPNNAWGSKIGENGGKGKACQDTVRLAVATVDQINDPYLIRVPPASIRALAEYGSMLKKRGVGYNMVATKIGFDIESPTPKLTFKPVGMLDDGGYAQVQEMLESDIVTSIIGSVFEVAAPLVEDETQTEVEQPPVIAPPKISTKKAPEVKKVPEVAEKQQMEVDLDLSGLSFDD